MSLGMDGVGKNSTSDFDYPLSCSEVGEDGLDLLCLGLGKVASIAFWKTRGWVEVQDTGLGFF